MSIRLFHDYVVSIGMGNHITQIHGSGKDCEITFLDSATEEYRFQVCTLRDNFDWDNPQFWMLNNKDNKKLGLIDKAKNFFSGNK